MTASVTPRWPQMKLFMLLWQADLAKIGVKLTVDEVEIAKFYDIGARPEYARRRRHPVAERPSPARSRPSSSAPSELPRQRANIFGYRNPELEKLIAEGAVELDPAKRKAIYQQLNEIVVDDAYLIHGRHQPIHLRHEEASTARGRPDRQHDPRRPPRSPANPFALSGRIRRQRCLPAQASEGVADAALSPPSAAAAGTDPACSRRF